MEHMCVHVAIQGASDDWAPVTAGLAAATDVLLVDGREAKARVDVVFYDATDAALAASMAALDPRREFWTIGIDLAAKQVVELSGSQFALTSVDDLAAVIRASGCALRSASQSRLYTGD